MLPYDEGDLAQPQIPPRTLYHQWNIQIKFSKPQILQKKCTSAYLNSLFLIICSSWQDIQNTQVASHCGCCWCDPAFSSPMNIQRFCRKCQKWFDEKCLVALGSRINKNVKAGLSPIYQDVYFDPKFLLLLTMPIQRGGSCGIVGNSLLLMQTDMLMDEAKMLGQLPEGWQDEINQELLPKEDDIIPRYYCLTCTSVMI